MILALLAGRKSMTRRLAWREVQDFSSRSAIMNDKAGRSWARSPWQRVKPGDRLWCRENFRLERHRIDRKTYVDCHYQAIEAADYLPTFKWRPSIHLPRIHSRLTLIVTAIKIEPLLDISEDDARAEGFMAGQLSDGFGPREFGGGYTIESPGTWCSAAGMFQNTWAKLHPKWDGYSSPEVIALSFDVHKINIDAMENAV